MKKISASDEILQEASNIVEKIYYPLEGFLDEENLKSVLIEMRLKNGKIWPMPIVFDVGRGIADKIECEKEIILANKKGERMFILSGVSTYKLDKKFFNQKLFGTEDKKHPGVAKILKMGDYLIGGKLHLLKKEKKRPHELFFFPSETKKIFKKNKWARVVAFQTRNPPHRSHEYIQKDALAKVDGLFVNPVIGKKKKGDFKDEYTIGAYEVLIKKHYPKGKVLLGTFHTFMRYAGPKEAVFHALVRRNFGCTHMIIGRDHAGAGSYYSPYDAHKIFDQFNGKELGIKILRYENAFFCADCAKMVQEGECRHGEKSKIDISGRKLRKKLKSGEKIREEFLRKDVVRYLKVKKNNLFY
jgi:sulfate adenylyltransferase